MYIHFVPFVPFLTTHDFIKRKLYRRRIYLALHVRFATTATWLGASNLEICIPVVHQMLAKRRSTGLPRGLPIVGKWRSTGLPRGPPIWGKRWPTGLPRSPPNTTEVYRTTPWVPSVEKRRSTGLSRGSLIVEKRWSTGLPRGSPIAGKRRSTGLPRGPPIEARFVCEMN